MKKISFLLSIMLVFALLLAACAPAEEGEEPGLEETPGLIEETPGLIEETPMVEETPLLEETPVVEETPLVEETEVVEETPLVEETPTQEPGAGLLETNPRFASDLLGLSVQDQAGEGFGEIEELVVDRNNGQIHYVIMGVGGFLDIGDKDILVPWSALNVNAEAAEENQLVATDLDREVVENAPAFDPGEPDVRAEDWDADIVAYWQDHVEVLPVTGEGATPADLFRIGDPTDIQLQNEAGEDVGDVEDMILNLDEGQISHLVWAVGGVLDISECLLAVPYENLTVLTEGEAETAADETEVAGTPAAGETEVAGTPAAVETEEGVAEAGDFVLVLNTEGVDFSTAPCVTTMDEFPDPRIDENWESEFDQFWANTTS